MIGCQGHPFGCEDECRTRCVYAGPSPDDWILEEHFSDDAMYLLDRKTSKLFTVPSENTWPRPIGVWEESHGNRCLVVHSWRTGHRNQQHSVGEGTDARLTAVCATRSCLSQVQVQEMKTSMIAAHNPCACTGRHMPLCACTMQACAPVAR